MDKQPSNQDLQRAWTNAIQSEGIAGAFSEDLLTLKTMRDLRTTWVGGAEWQLRCALDKYLQHYGCGAQS